MESTKVKLAAGGAVVLVMAGVTGLMMFDGQVSGWLKEQLRPVSRQHAADMATMAATHDTDIDALVVAHDAEMRVMRATHVTELANINRRLDAQENRTQGIVAGMNGLRTLVTDGLGRAADRRNKIGSEINAEFDQLRAEEQKVVHRLATLEELVRWLEKVVR